MAVNSGSDRAATADSSSSSASRSRPAKPEAGMPLALLVDDDVSFALGLAEVVGREGFSTKIVHTLKEAKAEIGRTGPDVLLVDLHLPDGNGMDLFKELEASPGTEVVLITGQATVDTAVEAMRRGASDYLVKPVDFARVKQVLTNVARTRELKEQIGNLRGELRKLGRFGPLIGASAPMQRVYDLIAKVAQTEATVLLTGETGTGKELVAETIHSLSRRHKEPFLPINCGAVSPNLIESELFGHERGSFTGADRMHRGYYERAHRGTLFLDEITEMPHELQNLVHRAFILAEDHIGLDCLPLGVQESGGSSLNLKVGTSLGEAERRLILATLEECEGDKKKAAEVLGISLKTLYNRLNEYKSA